ncbi:HMG-box [Aspergillus japonicus CBS 114.51]|uniref:HMG-box n=1 Tax=Aspergillus japonicus CBS 114.51 TaxID=1448312 RepID=A0A8T8WYZ6_ASPJA|nr:HMG-box [Aspergillus japonicus CBS 114.51]RAH80870.1 HMG-box [Aspergillus japonicus CBS 114.51]
MQGRFKIIKVFLVRRLARIGTFYETKIGISNSTTRLLSGPIPTVFGLAEMRSKNRDPKKEKPMPCIIQPLSVLTKNMARISIKDIESWVHRSSETRIQEVQRRKGRVTRPMNSFMLYRSAYAERTKQWLAQNDHRLVSEISGKSWKLEPREVRQKYEHLAEIEKHNHLKAHPDYRFSPTKIKRNSKGVGGEQPFKIVSESDSGLLPAFALNTATEISNSGHCFFLLYFAY